jgi:hypothetical protein
MFLLADQLEIFELFDHRRADGPGERQELEPLRIAPAISLARSSDDSSFRDAVMVAVSFPGALEKTSDRSRNLEMKSDRGPK